MRGWAIFFLFLCVLFLFYLCAISFVATRSLLTVSLPRSFWEKGAHKNKYLNFACGIPVPALLHTLHKQLFRAFHSLVSLSPDAWSGLPLFCFPSFQLLINPALLNKAEQKGGSRQWGRWLSLLTPSPPVPCQETSGVLLQVNRNKSCPWPSWCAAHELTALAIWAPLCPYIRHNSLVSVLIMLIIFLPAFFWACAAKFHHSFAKYSNKHLDFSPRENSVAVPAQYCSIFFHHFPVLLRRKTHEMPHTWKQLS